MYICMCMRGRVNTHTNVCFLMTELEYIDWFRRIKYVFETRFDGPLGISIYSLTSHFMYVSIF